MGKSLLRSPTNRYEHNIGINLEEIVQVVNVIQLFEIKRHWRNLAIMVCDISFS
jgi:hypothetical protein